MSNTFSFLPHHGLRFAQEPLVSFPCVKLHFLIAGTSLNLHNSIPSATVNDAPAVAVANSDKKTSLCSAGTKIQGMSKEVRWGQAAICEHNICDWVKTLILRFLFPLLSTCSLTRGMCFSVAVHHYKSGNLFPVLWLFLAKILGRFSCFLPIRKDAYIFIYIK